MAQTIHRLTVDIFGGVQKTYLRLHSARGAARDIP